MSQSAASRALEQSTGKRRQILDGARQVFQELGLDHASVDVIAARSGVSKATIYNHFHDKNALFEACYAEASELFGAELEAGLFVESSPDMEAALQRVGERLIEKLLSPAALSLQRSAAEAFSASGMGKVYFDRGPRVIFEAVAAALARWAGAGLLRLDDPYAAAVQFVMLCHGDLGMRAYLRVEPAPTPEEARATVRRAVQTFLRAFRP